MLPTHLLSKKLIWYANAANGRSTAGQDPERNAPCDLEQNARRLMAPGKVQEWSFQGDDLQAWAINSQRNNSLRTLAPYSVLVPLLHNYLHLHRQKNCQEGLLQQKNAAEHDTVVRDVVWIGEEIFPCPAFLAAYDLLDRSLFISCSSLKEKMWVFQEALENKGISVAITNTTTLPLGLSKRLTLAAQRGQAYGVLIIPPNSKFPTSSHARWHVESAIAGNFDYSQPTSKFTVTLERVKGETLPSSRWEAVYSILS